MEGYVLRRDIDSQKYIIQANLSFRDLIKYAQFTQMTDINSDPYCAGKVQTDEFYQRRVEPRRVKEIKDYIRKSIVIKSNAFKRVSLFPTTLLLATHWDVVFEQNAICSMDKFYDQISSLYIVDGQHRLYSMNALYQEILLSNDAESFLIKDYLDKYYFNCTILVNFDMWEQAQVFADVNFNQKTVNKSIYYSIYGMKNPSEDGDLTKTAIYFAHQLTRLMNIYEGSPLYRNIKMLGTGSGFISQSFFADSIIRNFQPRGIWYQASCTYSQEDFLWMGKELLSFFYAVKEVFIDQWPSNDNKHKSIITKTTGVGALVRLMAYLHINYISKDVLSSIHSLEGDKIVLDYVDVVTKCLKYINPNVFDFNGPFANTGGAGIEVKLYEEMVREIEAKVSSRTLQHIDNDNQENDENIITSQQDWLDMLYIDDYDDIDSLYHSVDSCMRYGIFDTKELENEHYLISSDLLDIKLKIESESSKREFLRLIEKQFCDDMPEEAWYGYQYAIHKDD